MIWSLTNNNSPFNQLKNLQDEMSNFLNNSGFHSSENRTFPAVNIWYNENEVLLSAELPGVDPNKINITVTGDQLTLEGERKPLTHSDDTVSHRNERKSGKYIRGIQNAI